MFQSHSEWNQEGEHSSKYFFGLEKNHSAYKTMNSTYLQNGQVTWEQALILNEYINSTVNYRHLTSR